MAVQKLAHDWRARRKKDGKTFNGPLSDTEVAANEDARQLEEASAVSSERLQEVFDRLSGLLSVPAATQHGSNWRTRVKVSQATGMWSDTAVQSTCRRGCARTAACAANFERRGAERSPAVAAGSYVACVLRRPSPNMVQGGALDVTGAQTQVTWSYQAVQGGC